MEFSENHTYNEYIQLQTRKSGIIISNVTELLLSTMRFSFDFKQQSTIFPKFTSQDFFPLQKIQCKLTQYRNYLCLYAKYTLVLDSNNINHLLTPPCMNDWQDERFHMVENFFLISYGSPKHAGDLVSQKFSNEMCVASPKHFYKLSI